MVYLCTINHAQKNTIMTTSIFRVYPEASRQSQHKNTLFGAEVIFISTEEDGWIDYIELSVPNAAIMGALAAIYGGIKPANPSAAEMKVNNPIVFF
jgi:hypothetical protein